MIELEWLANPVIVPKKNGKMRVYIDFTDLNKTYPKDSFPLPHIDRIVDATTGHEMLSFLDTFSGYNNILTRRQHSYRREALPFWLKNARSYFSEINQQDVL